MAELVFSNLTVTVSLTLTVQSARAPLNERAKLCPVYVSMCCIAVTEP